MRSLVRIAAALLLGGFLITAMPATGEEILPTVVIDGCDTGVVDRKGEDCLSISQKVSECAAAAENHGHFVSCITTLRNGLKKAGVLAPEYQGDLVSCAAGVSDEFIANAAQRPTPFRYYFQTADDDLGAALRAVYSAYVSVPAADAMARVNEDRNQAVLYLRTRPEQAAERLIRETQCLDPADTSRLQLVFHLLGWFVSETGVAFMHEYSAQPLPAAPPGTLNGEVTERELALTRRRSAVYQLGRLRHQGSDTARLRLLDLVSNADSQLRRLAIKTYYDGARHRWRAKKEMAPQLPPEARYLLHEIY